MADLEKIANRIRNNDEAEMNNVKHSVFECQFAEADTKGTRVCGLDGEQLDASSDECHHVLRREFARQIVAALNVDLPRLHRFLVEHGGFWGRDDVINNCIGCGFRSGNLHAPDCEWVALVEMTKP